MMPGSSDDDGRDAELLKRVELESSGSAKGHWEEDSGEAEGEGTDAIREEPEQAAQGRAVTGYAPGGNSGSGSGTGRAGAGPGKAGGASEVRPGPTVPRGASGTGTPSGSGNPRPFTLETRVPFEDGHPRVLAIYCSDGRYAEQVESLLNSKGHVLHDTITLPGGPGLFESWTGSFAMTDAVRRGSAFLVRNHGIEEVVLMAHADCGYYKGRFTAWGEERIREQQVRDMRTARDLLLLSFPSLRVEAWYATGHGESGVTFEKIEL